MIFIFVHTYLTVAENQAWLKFPIANGGSCFALHTEYFDFRTTNACKALVETTSFCFKLINSSKVYHVPSLELLPETIAALILTFLNAKVSLKETDFKKFYRNIHYHFLVYY